MKKQMETLQKPHKFTINPNAMNIKATRGGKKSVYPITHVNQTKFNLQQSSFNTHFL